MKNLLILFIIIFNFTLTAQTAEEIEMVTLVNQVRTNPKSFIPEVESYIKRLENATPFDAIKIKGAVVVKKTNNTEINFKLLITEAKALICFLNTVKPVKSLELSLVLYPITKSHVVYLDSIKQITHTGPNGETLLDRTKSLGLNVGENCSNGTSPTSAMLMLLIDYKVYGKGHRANIFNPTYTQISAAKSDDFWVQDFAY